MSKIYTGIGSRKTPQPILELMTHAAAKLARSGWMLRSGGAAGADSAFERGCLLTSGRLELYLPWQGFEQKTSSSGDPTPAAFALAKTIHPAWDRLSNGARKLHARNCHQILGADLQTPTHFVLCWTPSGNRSGGTGQALRLATLHNIIIFDLGVATIEQRLCTWLNALHN